MVSFRSRKGGGLVTLGTVVGLALLLPAYAIGGMGAGDVKLLAGVGAWVHSMDTFYAFCATAVIGAVRYRLCCKALARRICASSSSTSGSMRPPVTTSPRCPTAAPPTRSPR